MENNKSQMLYSEVLMYKDFPSTTKFSDDASFEEPEAHLTKKFDYYASTALANYSRQQKVSEPL